MTEFTDSNFKLVTFEILSADPKGRDVVILARPIETAVPDGWTPVPAGYDSTYREPDVRDLTDPRGIDAVRFEFKFYQIILTSPQLKPELWEIVHSIPESSQIPEGLQIIAGPVTSEETFDTPPAEPINIRIVKKTGQEVHEVFAGIASIQAVTL